MQTLGIDSAGPTPRQNVPRRFRTSRCKRVSVLCGCSPVRDCITISLVCWASRFHEIRDQSFRPRRQAARLAEIPTDQGNLRHRVAAQPAITKMFVIDAIIDPETPVLVTGAGG